MQPPYVPALRLEFDDLDAATYGVRLDFKRGKCLARLKIKRMRWFCVLRSSASPKTKHS